MKNIERNYSQEEFYELIRNLFGFNTWIECNHTQISNEKGIDYLYNLFNAKTREYAIFGYTVSQGSYYNVYAIKTVKKHEKKQEKSHSKLADKLKIFAGAGIIIGGVVGSFALYDATFDHTKAICPLTHVLGIEHQVDQINNSNGLKAVTDCEYVVSVSKQDGYDLEVTTKKNPKIRINSEGKFEEYGEDINYCQELLPKYTYEDKTVSVGPNEIMIINDTSSEVVKKLVLK